MNQNPAIKHWNQTKLALLIAVVTTIFTNIFWGILVFLAIGFWVSRNEPVKDVPHYDDLFPNSVLKHIVHLYWCENLCLILH